MDSTSRSVVISGWDGPNSWNLGSWWVQLNIPNRTTLIMVIYYIDGFYRPQIMIIINLGKTRKLGWFINKMNPKDKKLKWPIAKCTVTKYDDQWWSDFKWLKQSVAIQSCWNKVEPWWRNAEWWKQRLIMMSEYTVVKQCRMDETKISRGEPMPSGWNKV